MPVELEVEGEMLRRIVIEEGKEERRVQVEREDRAFIERDVDIFLSSAKLTAKWMLDFTEGRYDTDGKGVMAFISKGSLEQNPEAAVIAKCEYERFLTGLPPEISMKEVIPLMLSYYEELSRVYKERGISV